MLNRCVDDAGVIGLLLKPAEPHAMKHTRLHAHCACQLRSRTCPCHRTAVAWARSSSGTGLLDGGVLSAQLAMRMGCYCGKLRGMAKNGALPATNRSAQQPSRARRAQRQASPAPRVGLSHLRRSQACRACEDPKPACPPAPSDRVCEPCRLNCWPERWATCQPARGA